MIVLSPDAIADIDRMRSFLNNKNPGAAQRAMALILSAIERLQDFPDRGLPTGDGIRQIVIKFGASGYVIRYAIIPETEDILITRIWHGREERA
jgi:plasmid stabilization system protein ParE